MPPYFRIFINFAAGWSHRHPTTSPETKKKRYAHLVKLKPRDKKI